MDLKRVEESLRVICEDLDDVEERRTRLLRESRDVISLAGRSIVDMHGGRMREARMKLSRAGMTLRQLRRVAGQDLDRYLIPPETEYVEAKLFYSIVFKRPIPSHTELSVTNTSYLLGLGDLIGEVKRLVYDQIRKGRSNEASALFDSMERLYILLSPYAAYDNVAQGVRRKLDVCRMLVENTRSAVTEEIRRAEFREAVDRLSKRLAFRSRRKKRAPRGGL